MGIQKYGCENVKLTCEATDMDFIMSSTNPKFKALQTCLKTKCPSALPTQQLSDASSREIRAWTPAAVIGGFTLSGTCVSLILLGIRSFANRMEEDGKRVLPGREDVLQELS